MIDCAVAVVIDEKGNVLIAQRKKEDSFGGFWEFPGGKREEGESLEECLIREIEEEVGLEIKIQKFLRKIENPYKNKQINLHFFLCEPIGGCLEPKECEQVSWVRPDQLKEYTFPPANEIIIESLSKDIVPNTLC